jgi:hypothetical protein
MHPGPGPLALVGSGEYLAVMAGVEGALIEGRPPRYVQLPTAAAPEGGGKTPVLARPGRLRKPNVSAWSRFPWWSGIATRPDPRTWPH